MELILMTLDYTVGEGWLGTFLKEVFLINGSITENILFGKTPRCINEPAFSIATEASGVESFTEKIGVSLGN